LLGPDNGYILRPDAQSSDPFRNPKDVEKAIHLAGVSLSRAERLARKLGKS
jgi:hypothetical protein